MISQEQNMFNTSRYIKLRDAFEGDGGFNNGAYLRRFYKEASEKFLDRCELAYYDNNFETIVKAYSNPIYSKVISNATDKAPEQLPQFLNNCDGTGASFREKFTKTATTGEYMGFMLYYFDAECIDVKNQQEQINSNMYPKIQTIAPDKIVNLFRINDRGEIVYLEFTKKDEYGYEEIWTYKRGLIAEKKIDKKGEEEVVKNNFGDNGIFITPKGKVIDAYSPIYIYSLEVANEPNEFSKSDYISTLSQQEAIYRLDSVATFQTHDATFSIFVTDDKGLDPKNFNIGENNVIVLNPERDMKSIAIEYTADKIRATSSEIKENMFQDKNLSVNISSNASGISREYADKMYVSALQDKSKKAMQEEIKIIQRFLKLIKDLKNYEISDLYEVVYPKEFTPNAESILFDYAETLINNLGISPESEVKIKQKLLTNIIFSDESDEEKDKIRQDETNNMNSSEE